MKHSTFILLLLLAFTFSARSQAVDTAVRQIVAYKVRPVKFNLKDSLVTNRVGIRGLVDDFKASLTIYVESINISQQTLNNAPYTRVITISSWNEVLTGTDYTNYDGSPEYIIGFLSRKYGLTLEH